MCEDDGLPIDVDELTLRRVEFGDRGDLFEMYSNPLIARYQFFEPWTPEQVEQFVLSQSQVHAGDPGVPLVLVVVLRAENKVIGDCQITIHSPQLSGSAGRDRLHVQSGVFGARICHEGGQCGVRLRVHAVEPAPDHGGG
jgi:RimJ/RimL family protein N-acetyltransferase